MSKYCRAITINCLLFCLCFVANFAAAQEGGKQDTFRNPAMEPKDEAQQALDQARIFAMQGRIDQAIKTFQKAAELKKGQCADCYQGLGMVHFQTGQYKDAALAFKQAIALKPENEAVLANLLGVSLYLQDDKKTLEEAAAAFRKAIDLSKDSMPKAHYNLGYALIKAGKEAEGIAELQKYVTLEPDSPNAESARDVINNPKLAKVQLASDFKVKATDGKELWLRNLRGKVVLLDFWASWCGPCRVEMPAVKKVWQKYGGEKFVIVGINMDHTKEAFESYVKTEGLTWPQYYDGLGWNNKITKLYGVRGIPYTVLIDKDGAVRAVSLRGNNLYNKIADLVKEAQEQKLAETK
jgi:Flp pilus assembly protein TadD/peroxiredoxin